MEYFPWWTEAQIKLAEDAKKFTDEVLIPIGEKAAWTKQFPWEGVKEVAKKGYFGAMVPAKYGGHAEEWGVTGAAIIIEEVSRANGIGSPLGTTMFGGIHQMIHDGTEEQKQRWLPSIAKGEWVGSITMTEPYAGSDVAGIETTAVRDGDFYIVNGKKRFQTNVGAARNYLTYVKTSTSPEDRAKNRHLSSLVIERGMPGFNLEKINDMMALDGGYNGYLTFNNARVPVANRISEEGDGWRVMMSGLNVERVLNAAPALGQIREALRYAVQHLQRRVQFNAPTGDIATNQFKIADMIWKLNLARLSTYYAAYCADLGREIPVEAAISKMFSSDQGFNVAVEAVQVMGGNGTTKYYPVERIMRDLKVRQIAAGTSEVLKLLIYRMGTRALAPDLKVPYRFIDEEFKVPMSLGTPPPPKPVEKAEDILEVLAENYRINPGLHMTMEDIKERLEVSDEDLEKHLLSLEEKGLVGLYHNRRGALALAKATYQGLEQAHTPEYYKYFPEWFNKDDMF